MKHSIISVRPRGPDATYHSDQSLQEKGKPVATFAQDFMVPLQATLDTSWHLPAKKRVLSTMTVRLSLSDLHLQPSFGHVPMLQALMDQARVSSAKRTEVRL